MVDLLGEVVSWRKEKGISDERFAGMIGKPRSSLRGYLAENQRMPEDVRERIYEITGLETFAEPIEFVRIEKKSRKYTPRRNSSKNEDLMEAMIGLEKRTAQVVKLIKKGRRTSREEMREDVRVIKNAFYDLTDALESITTATDDSLREGVTKAIPRNDVGYLTSLLGAMYSKEGLSRWVLRSGYVTEGDRNE